MSTISIDLEEDLVALLHQSNQPVARAVREFIVLELYRRGAISSGKAAQLLGMSRVEVLYLQRTDNCRSASSGGISPFHHHRRETTWDTTRFSMHC